MSTTTLNTRVKWKRDTSANWTANNPVLLDGEIIIVDTNAGETRFKIGNGTSTYTQLPFQDEYLQNSITSVNDNLLTHESNMSNPHNVDAIQVGLGNVANVLQYSASNPPPYPVTSVNSQTGAVNLSAASIGALPVQTGAQGQFLGFTANNVVGAVDAPSGVDIQTSGTQPTNQKTGDFWYQIV